jgi:hypothetical protein
MADGPTEPAVAAELKSASEAGPSPTPLQELWAAAKAQGHPEIWGVTLADPDSHVPSQIVFQKYLNANDGDVAKAKDQLVKTLAWRAETKPQAFLNKTFNRGKFEGLGYVASYSSSSGEAADDPELKEVFTGTSTVA